MFNFFFNLTKSNAFKQGSTLNCNGDDGRGRAISQDQPAPALYREASQPSNKAGKSTEGWGSGALTLWLSSPIAPGKKPERKALFDLSLPALL